MPYGTIKVDTITFTAGGVDTNVSISGLVQNPTFSGNITTTGNITGANVIGTTTVSGATVTGTTGNFAGTITAATVVGTTTVSGATVTGNTGSFTTLTGGVTTITSGVFAAGSATNPSISFTSDPNSGLFSPGADQVAISTNGTGRLFVDASGRVGIGTAPSSLLHLQVPSGSAQIQFKSGSNTDSYFGLDTAYNTGLDIASGGATTFRNFNGAIFSETLRITAAGLLGLGTSSPGALLHLSATAGNQELRLSDTTNTAMGRMYVANGTYLISETAHPIVFQTNATNRMTIDSSGNVNIDSNTLYVDATNNRVGIGATTVGDLLHLRAATTPHLRIDHTTTSSFGAVQFYEDTTQQASIGALGSTSSGTGGGNALQIWNFLNAPTVFATNNQERARIDSSGRLLVGTSSSRAIYGISSAIQIEGTGFDTSSLSLICNNNGSQSAYLALGRTRGTSVGSTTTIANGDILGAVSFTGAHNSGLTGASASITGYVDGTPGANDIPGRLEFSTTADGASSPTERMRIDQNGHIKTYSTGNGHTVNVSAGGGTSTFIYAGNRSSTDVQGSGGTTVYYVYSNGNVQNTNGSYTTLSDAKLKENIVDAHSQWNDLKAIQIRNWNFKNETGYETHRQIGPVAQELEQVCPGLVFETQDRDADGNETGEVTKGVNQSVLYMKAVKALQEAMERIEQLEASNADLLARVTALES